MPPTDWQEIVNSIEHAQRPSSTGEARPSAAEKTGSPSYRKRAVRDGTIANWRRSERVPIEIPVNVCVCEEGREPVFFHATTVDVSAHGALLDVEIPIDIGQTLRIVNVRTKREIECHVLRFAKRYPEGGGHVGVEFAGVSRHFWAIPSPPADWNPDWVPPAPPNQLASLAATAAGTGLHVAHQTKVPDTPHFGTYASLYNRLKKSPVLTLSILILPVILMGLWLVARGSRHTGAATNPAALEPEDAARIPRIDRLRLAISADFDPDASSWLRGLGQQASGKIPGFYSGSKKSNAYVLVDKANARHVVIFADGELRYNAEYPGVAVAACVPMELVHKIHWAESAPPESDGDGLLIVRAADAPASSVVLFLRGSRVLSASPVDYREVAFGQGCPL